MLVLFYSTPLFSQSDTVIVKKNQVIILSDSLIIPKSDTLLIIPKKTEYYVYSDKYILSDGFYDSLYDQAQKSRVTKELYDLLVARKSPKESELGVDPVQSEKYFEAFQGKTIGSIVFTQVELLEGSIYDTAVTTQSSLGKLSNRLHKDTEKAVLAKQLLFKKGDQVDPFQMADSERIVRSLPFIEDARILMRLDQKNNDIVHVTLISKDRFPWVANAESTSDGALFIGFTNRNILGTGNEFGVKYFYHNELLPTHGYDLSYTFRNIQNSFVDATLYTLDNYRGKGFGARVKRDFISPEIKYYGEALVEKLTSIRDLVFADSLYEENFSIERFTYDVWGARSFQIDQRKNLSFALRLDHDDFSNRPMVAADSNTIYHDHHLLLGGLSFSRITYLKAKNILSFNITEDIPEGYFVSLLYGRDWNEFSPRTYQGFYGNIADYNAYGYFIFNVETGVFQNDDDTETNNVLEINARHFTPIIDFGRTNARFFTRFHYFDGDQLSIPYTQTLNGTNRMGPINGDQIAGDHLITATLEYVVYQPWFFYGFRFATLANTAIGHVKESRIPSPYNKTYWSLGGGLQIRNESLVFNTFEFRVSAFPISPPNGSELYFSFSLSTPSFFQSPSVRKPRVVGLD